MAPADELGSEPPVYQEFLSETVFGEVGNCAMFLPAIWISSYELFCYESWILSGTRNGIVTNAGIRASSG
jgi:hypothetical protein